MKDKIILIAGSTDGIGRQTAFEQVRSMVDVSLQHVGIRIDSEVQS